MPPHGACGYLLRRGGEKVLPHICFTPFILVPPLPFQARPFSKSHPCRFPSSATSIVNNNSSKFSSPGPWSVALGAAQPCCTSLCLHSLCGCACALKYMKCVGNRAPLPPPLVVQFGMQYPTPWLFAHGNIMPVPVAGRVARRLYSLPLKGAGSAERAGNSPG